MVAAARGSSYIVSRLIQAGADIEATEIKHRTALMNAALKGRASTVVLLIKNGASITRHDIDGKRILSMAVAAKSFELVNDLLLLHDLALEENPPRLLFTSRDSGHAIQDALAKFEIGEFRRGLSAVYQHWIHARHFQTRHQQRYGIEEMNALEEKWQNGVQVRNEDQEPYDIVIVDALGNGRALNDHEINELGKG
ncbi:hypothetical protein BDZ45DRAFT_808334 [Acephala macrosclerotiorum]|nr:hypothetical protein BDZ45DRAFT_808334 [Acephala macrosclerotiorum]